MQKDRICFIRAKLEDDYCFDAIKSMGYQINIPFKDYNIFLRILREVWFRLHLPYRKIWYSKELRYIQADVIIIYDPLITPDLVDWLKLIYSSTRIILCYENRANSTISPESVKNTEKWSYDIDDCNRYSMKFLPGAYFDIYRIIKKDISDYDVLYLGRDKGRAEKLLDLQQTLNSLGLRTFFHICADRQFLHFKKKFYKPLMSYKSYLQLLRKSKAVLNLVQDQQTSITMRDFEVVFNGVKGITNNKDIRNFKLYHPSRYFILGEENIEKINEFLSTPFIKVPEEELEEFKFEKMIEWMLTKVDC